MIFPSLMEKPHLESNSSRSFRKNLARAFLPSRRTRTDAAERKLEGEANMEVVGGPQAERSRRLAAQTARVFPPTFYTPPAPSIPDPPAPVAARGDLHDRPTWATSSLEGTPTRISAPLVALPTCQCAPAAPCHVQIAQLNDEKAFLTKYAERLLVQLRLLLHKHGELDKLKAITDPSVAVGDADKERESDVAERRLPPWMAAREVVHPLLQAYDIKIYELVRERCGVSLWHELTNAAGLLDACRKTASARVSRQWTAWLATLRVSRRAIQRCVSRCLVSGLQL
jgi:hypothetical protein